MMLMRMIDSRPTFPLAQQSILVNNELQIFCAGFSAVQRLAENIILILNNFNETEKTVNRKFSMEKLLYDNRLSSKC